MFHVIVTSYSPLNTYFPANDLIKIKQKQP